MIEPHIFLLRGQRVMLDVDPAVLYGVETRALNQAVKRNVERFPEDFLFLLTREEIRRISQNVTSSPDRKRLKFSKQVAAFTEHGVAMLSSVLRSPRAIQADIEIMRTFARLRHIFTTTTDLTDRLNALEKHYDTQLKIVFDAISELMPQPELPRKKIGFET